MREQSLDYEKKKPHPRGGRDFLTQKKQQKGLPLALEGLTIETL